MVGGGEDAAFRMLLGPQEPSGPQPLPRPWGGGGVEGQVAEAGGDGLNLEDREPGLAELDLPQNQLHIQPRVTMVIFDEAGTQCCTLSLSSVITE